MGRCCLCLKSDEWRRGGWWYRIVARSKWRSAWRYVWKRPGDRPGGQSKAVDHDYGEERASRCEPDRF